MSEKYSRLEEYLRSLLSNRAEVTLTFERIEQILKERLPQPASQDRAWWGGQKHGTPVETIAGWIVDTVDLDQKWVRLVRQ